MCLACFFTPLSTSLLGLFSILAVAAWLLSGGFLDLPRQFRANPSCLVALLFFCLMVAALTYSPVPPMEGFATLRKYRELLLMPVIYSLFSLGSSQRQHARLSFLAGCVVLMIISYLGYFDLFDSGRYGYSIVFHITHSFFMAVLAFWTMHKASEKGWRRYCWLLVCAAAVINLIYVAPGRTGMFVFCCLTLLYLYQRLSMVKWAVSIVIFALLLVAAYHSSDNFSSRVEEAVSEMMNYETGRSRTSIGQRFDWWKVSLQLVKDKPLLGHGTGSYETMHRRATRSDRVTPTDNPHNEYLFISCQFGLVGLSMFFLMLILQLQEARGISLKDRQLLHGVLLALLAGSLMNSLLFDSQQGHFYLFMSGALLASGD